MTAPNTNLADVGRSRRILGRYGYECGCDYCQIIRRYCMLCTTPKRPDAFPICGECNAFYNESEPEERRHLMGTIVTRLRRRACASAGTGS